MLGGSTVALKTTPIFATSFFFKKSGLSIFFVISGSAKYASGAGEFSTELV